MIGFGRHVGWFGILFAGFVPAYAQGLTADRSTEKPAVFIQAPVEKVHEALLEIAPHRGFYVTQSGRNGVTIEAPSQTTNKVVEVQCGPHRPGRIWRIRFVTASIRGGTALTEDRFMVDPGRSPCRYSPAIVAVRDRNVQLDQFKRKLEGGGSGFPPLFGR